MAELLWCCQVLYLDVGGHYTVHASSTYRIRQLSSRVHLALGTTVFVRFLSPRQTSKKISYKRKGLFWFGVSEVKTKSIVIWPCCFWAWDNGQMIKMKLLYGQEWTRERKKQESKNPLQKHTSNEL